MQIEFKRYTGREGKLQGFADVALQTEHGEVVMKSFKVLLNDKGEPWVALPSQSYMKDGKEQHKAFIECNQHFKRVVAEKILEAYRLTLKPPKPGNPAK
jgi:hypothetical protein